MATATLGRRDAYEKLRGALDTEFATFFPLLKDVADYTCPRRPQFFVTDNNRGDRRSGKIIDGIAAKSADTFASGMMGGNTSPTSPWVRMTTSRPIAVEDYAGKEYLDGVTDSFLDVCAKSNVYDSFRSMYYDGANFATAVILIERDAERVFHSTSLPIGSYRLGLGKHDEVAVLFREFRMTVRSLIEEFGMEFGEEDIHWERFSAQIKQHYDQNHLEVWIDVCHVICPNKEYDPDRMESKYKKFTSCYYEKGRGSGTGSYEVGDKYLRESGYDKFPALIYHFDRSSGDAYGTNCPGFTCLGDNKALQNLHKKHAQAVDKMVHPPMGAPAGMEKVRWSTLPNDIAYWDPAMFGAQGGKIEPLYQVQPNTGDLKEMIQDLRYQIKEAYYVDVILSLINPAIDPKQMTAREVDERHDEKYMRFGSVLERVKPVLAGLVELVLPWMYEDGLLDDPPESLQGEDIKLEFISALAASQKLVRLGGIERFTQYTISLAQALAVPGARDVFAKVNVDNLMDSYAEGCSLPSKCMATDDQAMQTRQAAAQLQAQQSMVQAAPQLAKAAKDASQADTSGDNALTRVAGALQGAGQ
jgi:hypothetical protein